MAKPKNDTEQTRATIQQFQEFLKTKYHPHMNILTQESLDESIEEFLNPKDETKTEE